MSVNSLTPINSTTSAEPMPASFSGRLKQWLVCALAAGALVSSPIANGPSFSEKTSRVETSPEKTREKICIIRTRTMAHLSKVTSHLDRQEQQEKRAEYKSIFEAIDKASSVDEALDLVKKANIPNLVNYHHLTVDTDSYFPELLMAKPIQNHLGDFVRSILTGKEDKFDCLGMQVIFKTQTDGPEQHATNYWGARSITKLTGSLMHTFIHEFGHALTYKAFGADKITMNIHINNDMGACDAKENDLSQIEDSVVSAAGPIFHVGTIAIGMLLLNKLSHTHPILAASVSMPLLYEAFVEALYVAYSSWKQDDGDFGCIRKNSLAHWALSTGMFSIATTGTAHLASQIFQNAYSSLPAIIN